MKDIIKKEVMIVENDITLHGILAIPKNAKTIILFAHGSGSGRLSPRNQFVAEELNNAGFATLLMDLLTEEEEVIDNQTAELRFDIPLLAERLVVATRWLKKYPPTEKLKVAYFGASTGAPAALIAASELKEITAIVSRGGRPDLAMDVLSKVKAPTLLIVGGDDTEVIEMNEAALGKLKHGKLEIVKGATHLFEEAGKLEEVARLASDWFKKHAK